MTTILAVAAVAAISAAAAVQHLTLLWWEFRAGLLWRGDTVAVSSDLYYGARFWVAPAAVLTLIAVFSYRGVRTTGEIPLPLGAAALSTAIVFGFVVLVLTLAFQNSPGPHTWREFGLFCWGMLMQFAPGVFLAGLLAGAWFAQRRGRFRSLARLLLSAAAAGALAGALLLPLYLSSSRPAPGWREYLVLPVAGAVPGIVCGLIAALPFRARLMARTASFTTSEGSDASVQP